MIMSPKALILAAWQELLDKDDRTSPEEYPDMALITFEEFESFANGVIAASDHAPGEQVAEDDIQWPEKPPSRFIKASGIVRREAAPFSFDDEAAPAHPTEPGEDDR